jgi:cytoskeletal protein RodZ
MGSEEGDSTSTIGPLLQGARTAKGLTIEAAAAASKVPLSFIRLMEQEQFHLVPDPMYLIRFLTEYATFLGLDPKQVAAQMKDQVNAARMSEPSHPAPSIGQQINLRRLALYLLPAVVVIPLIFIGLSLLVGRPPALPPAPQPELPESQSATPPTPEAGTATLPGPQATAVGAGQAEGVNPVSPITDPAAQRPQGPPPRYRLKAEAKDTTWLGVSADGAPRKGVLLHSGETASWSANDGFVITIGNSGGVALMLNGRPILLKGARGQVIQNLALPESSGPPLAGQ